MPFGAIVAFAVAVAAPIDVAPACSASVQKYAPPKGMAPTQKVALSIAKTYLFEIYGADIIAMEEPLKASLRRGVWLVEGSLKPGWKGGVAEIEICQSNGRVLSVTHGK